MKLSLVLFLGTLLYLPQMGHAQPQLRSKKVCRPQASLLGEADLVAALAIQLGEHGISTMVSPDCPSVQASIEKVSTGLFVSLRDASGTTAYRNLSDLRIAAIWIDSRIHDDLASSLLVTRSIPTSAPLATASVVATSTRSASAPATRHWIFSADYLTETANNAVRWTGFRADVCRQFQFGCYGLSARLSESGTIVEDDDFQEFSQDSISLSAQASFPFQVGRSTLVPHLGIGANRIISQRKTDAPCETDPLVPQAPDCIEFGKSRISWAPSIEVGAYLSLPITSALRVKLGGATQIRPLGSGRSLVSQTPPAVPPECEENPTPNCFPPPDSPDPLPDVLAMPADPIWLWRLSIGLQVQL